MEKSEVEISVLLPVYNGMPFLPEAVESVLQQTFRNFEFLIIDDGSTDDTPGFVKSLQDPRIVYHRIEKVGLVGALNYGLAQARAPVIARLDADDVACVSRLEKQYAYLKAHPDCVLLSCDFEYIDKDGIGHNIERTLRADVAIRWLLLFTSVFLHPGAMYRRDDAIAVGGYRSQFPDVQAYAEDYDLWTRLAARGRMTNIPEVLMHKRGHTGGASFQNRELQHASASMIAGNYAASLSQDFDANEWAEFQRFVWTGRLPQQTSIPNLLRSFQLAKKRFLQDTTDVPMELTNSVLLIQEKLRWHCMEQAKQNWMKPIQFVRWMHLAGRFDPDNGTVRKIFARRLKSLSGRSILESRTDTSPNELPLAIKLHSE